MRRLREFAAVENDCCSLVDWTVDEHQAALRFVVTGDSGQLVALYVGSGGHASVRARLGVFASCLRDCPTLCGDAAEFRFHE